MNVTELKVGNIFAKLVSSIGFNVTEVCNCTQNRDIMNAWGPKQCRQHISALVTAIETETVARKVFIPTFLIRSTIKLACNIVERPDSLTSLLFQKMTQEIPKK